MNRRAFTLAGVGVVVFGRAASAQTGTPVLDDPAGNALISVSLEGEVLPTGSVIAGVVSTSMTAGTQVVYAEGGSPESLVIDHVLQGGYTVQSDSERRVVRADGSIETFAPGEDISVASGESLVLIDNELEATFAVGDEDTETLTIGLFTLGQGSNQMTVDGELDAVFVSGSQPVTLPERGVRLVVLETSGDDERDWPGALLQLPFETTDGPVRELILIPAETSATPDVAATPAS